MAKKTSSAQVNKSVLELFRARRDGIMDMYRRYQQELDEAVIKFEAFYGPNAVEGLAENVRLKLSPAKRMKAVKVNGLPQTKPKIRRRRTRLHGRPTIKSMLDAVMEKTVKAMGGKPFSVRQIYDHLIKVLEFDPRALKINHCSLYLSRHAEKLGLKARKIKPEHGRSINEFSVIKKRRARKPVRGPRKTVGKTAK